MGDHIVVLNAQKIQVTGRKLTDKIYYHHTGYIGGIKSIALEKLLAEHPERAIEFAVKGMLPKNPLGGACSGNCTCLPAASTRTRPSSPSRSSSNRTDTHASDSESLRHRPPQDRHRAGVPEARQRTTSPSTSARSMSSSGARPGA